jgi:hypothetical protein
MGNVIIKADGLSKIYNKAKVVRLLLCAMYPWRSERES